MPIVGQHGARKTEVATFQSSGHLADVEVEA